MKRYFNKYLITLIVFGILVVFLDENSLLRRLRYTREEHLLELAIEEYRKEYEESTRLLNELTVDTVAIEQIARERYLMKRADEDIYVFEEDLK